MENEMELMQDIQVSLTFSELQCLGTEDVASCVSKQTALQICNQSLEDLSAKTVEVLGIWLRKLLKAYILEAECCIDIFKCLYEWFQRLKELVGSENLDAIADMTTVLDDARDFALWAKDNLVKTSERLVHTAAFFLLSVVCGFLEQRYDNNVEALVEHQPVTIDIHFAVLGLLQETTSNSQKAHARITPLLRQLIDVANFLDYELTQLHALLKTSKNITDMCAHYTKCEEQRQDDSMPEYLQDVIIHLGHTIIYHMGIVCEEAPGDKLKDHLKVAQAHLIMLHKLFSSGVRKMNLTVYQTIHVLLNGSLLKAGNLDNDTRQLISQYVRQNLMELYELIYRLEDFQKHLVTYLTEPDLANDDHYELCLDFITVAIMDDAEIGQHTCQTLQQIFEYLFKDDVHFTTAAHYDRIIEAYASLLYTANPAELFQFFITGLFQEDIFKSQVCSDVLLLSFRLTEANQNWSQCDIVEATNYWIKCNSSYAMFSSSMSQWHVQRMLKYFHNLGNKDPPLFSLSNHRYLHCVSAGTEKEQRLWLMRIQRILMTPFSNKEQYYELLALMELMAIGQMDWLHLISGNVQELLLRDASNCKALTSVFFKLALKASKTDQLRILQGSIPPEPMLSNCWYLQKFLYVCRKSDDPQLKVLTNQYAIAKDFQLILNAPGHKADTHTQRNNYKWNYRHLQTHYCNAETNCLKRKRLQNEPKELIQQLEQNSEQLLRCSGGLDGSDLLQLRNIINNLNSILPKI